MTANNLDLSLPSKSETKVVRFDWAVKYFLRNKANFDVLEGFLSELLKTDIKIDHLLESESTPTHEKAKLTRVDLLADTDKGKVIIEVQVEREADYLSRILFGASKAVTDYMKKGERYFNVQKVYSVSILYFNLGIGSDYLYRGATEFRGIHTHDLLGLTSSQKNIYQHAVETPSDIFPEYYLIRLNQFRDSIQEKFDEWVYFFKNESVKPSFSAKGIQSAADKLAICNMSEEQRLDYEHYLTDLSYEASMLDTRFLEGEIKGKAEGKAEGKQEIAKTLKTRGFSSQEIADITGVPLDEIESL